MTTFADAVRDWALERGENWFRELRAFSSRKAMGMKAMGMKGVMGRMGVANQVLRSAIYYLITPIPLIIPILFISPLI